MITTLDLGNGPRKFFNGTPHSINLIADAVFRQEIRKHVGGVEIAEIPPSGVLLSAKLDTQPVIDLGSGVEIARQIAVACDELSEEAKSCDYVIVSAMYAVAYRQVYGDDGVPLVTIRDLVVESVSNPKPKGCRGFALV